MTRDDIIKWAREAGFRFADEEDPLLANHAEWQRRLFEQAYMQGVVAGADYQRELCAQVCESLDPYVYDEATMRASAMCIRSIGIS
jgi:hypothetical protein